ncbi:MAG: hypothetical protein WDZ80_03440 [Candidatus Paceibacterota bacterium]
MGWKGTLRSVNSAIKASERESRRKQRELERQRKQYNKMVELEQAQYEVEQFENYLERVTSIHLEKSNNIDWKEIASKPKPKEPNFTDKFEHKAQKELDSYKPSFFDNIFNRTEKKREALSLAVENARKKDEKYYEQLRENHEQNLIDWKDSKEFAQRVLEGDQEAWSEAIEELAPFSEISELGANLSFTFEKSAPVQAKINVHGEDIIPNQKKSLLKSGKLSTKNMPKGEFFELYQDYVCSVVLRIAGELFSILPASAVVITAVDDLLNSSIGHIEEQAILSVAIPRKTFDKLNLQMIDPSDSMENFVHNMDFKKTKGFNTVEIVEWQNLNL